MPVLENHPPPGRPQTSASYFMSSMDFLALLDGCLLKSGGPTPEVD